MSGGAPSPGICHSYTPDGRCVSLLKILLTNVCVYDCRYCINRISSDTERARFTPEEVVDLTLEFFRRNYIEGLFLSSGVIKSPDYTMEQMLAVVSKLRDEHDFRGYVHLKVVPGASPELIESAGRLADRVSANIELPTDADLSKLAPEKKFEKIESAMAVIKTGHDEWAEEKKNPSAPTFAPAGQSTQMIVGATATSDLVILETASRLYDVHQLKRVYYSAYSPIPSPDARLPRKPPPLLRENRLYQADMLIRQYGFTAGELLAPDRPQLDPDLDPKLAWALLHRETFPIDVNRAPRESLLRVPGIGTKNARRIIQARRYRKLTLLDLAQLKVALTRAKPFVITADHNPDVMLLDRADLVQRMKPPASKQLSLFADAEEEVAT